MSQKRALPLCHAKNDPSDPQYVFNFPYFCHEGEKHPSYTNGKTRKRTAVLRVVFVPSYTNGKTRKHTEVLRVEKGRFGHFLIPFDGKTLKGLRVTS